MEREPDYNIGSQENPSKQAPLEVSYSELPISKPDSEIDGYREVNPGELKLSELSDTSLDAQGVTFKKEILENLVDSNTYPPMKLESFSADLNLVIDALKAEYPNTTLKDIVKLGMPALAEKVYSILPKAEITARSIMLSPDAKNELQIAAGKLSEQLQNKITQSKKSQGVIKRMFTTQSPEEQNEMMKLKNQIEFLRYVKNVGALNKEILNQPVTYIDAKDGSEKSGFLYSALEFGNNIQFLPDYIKSLNAKNASEVTPMKIVSALQMMAEGYGAKPFDEGDSRKQFTTGTAFAPRTGSANYSLKKNFYTTIKVKPE